MNKILEKLALAAFNWGLRRLLAAPDLPKYTPKGLTYADVKRQQDQIDTATSHKVD